MQRLRLSDHSVSSEMHDYVSPFESGAGEKDMEFRALDNMTGFFMVP
jgi:hypothetical protein